MSGNAVGLDRDTLQALSENERSALRRRAVAEFERAGAHDVVDSVADLMPVIDRIEGRLARGERPWSRIASD
jgi:phosphonoacetaldehyde hydrolase